LPRNVRVALLIDDKRFLRHELLAATTDEPQPNDRDEPVHTGQIGVMLTPAHRLQARVVYEDTLEPALGAEVRYERSAKQSTDAEGRFTAVQLPAGTFDVSVYAPLNSDHFGRYVSLPIPAGKPIVEHVITLPRGAEVGGRVLDDKTRSGVAGVSVCYFDRSDEPERRSNLANQVLTDENGVFRIVVPEGQGELVIFGHVPGYVTHQRSGSLRDAAPEFRREIQASLDTSTKGIEFRLKPVHTFSGRVVDGDGAPIECLIESKLELGQLSHRRQQWSTDAQGAFNLGGLFTVSGVPKEHDCQVVFRNLQRNLGASRILSHPGDEQPPPAMEVVLQPMETVHGQVLDRDCKPLANAVVYMIQWQGSSGEPCCPQAVAADGRFKFESLVPGVKYMFQVVAEGYRTMHSPQLAIEAESGRVRQLGALRMFRGQRITDSTLTRF
jgi:hypothetical protein